MAERPHGTDPAARLIAATGRRLYVASLLLVALLVVGIGVVTAVAATRALDSEVDRALTATAEAALARLDGELPARQETPEADEAPAGSADTFVLVLDARGGVVANPSRVALRGLPVVDAIARASAPGGDVRKVGLGGVSVRLLTLPIGDARRPVGYVQAGFVLTLHDAQSTSLVVAVALVGLVGLLGATLVTLVVTRRALEPIRRTFAAQLRFVADASHELRTPAAIIRSSAEVLERESLVAPEGRALVEDIAAESDRLGRMVGDLLTLSSTGAQDLVLERGPVDLAEIAGAVTRRAARLANDRDVVLRVDAAGQAIVQGDRDRLLQVVFILVDNALEHAPAGSSVAIAVGRRGAAVELSVTDAGPGIPAAERERIFEPFARLDGPARRRRGGAGLGLAIARRLIAAHGGTVAATAAADGGARFVVTLPASREATPE
jgi:signal transduction histidine kinase